VAAGGRGGRWLAARKRGAVVALARE